MRISKKHQRMLAIVIVLVLVIATTVAALTKTGIITFPAVKLNIAPNYNGYHLDFYGIELPNTNTVYTANNPKPCLNVASCSWVSSISGNGKIGTSSSPYSWIYNTQSASLKWCPSACSTLQVTTNVYNPNNNPLTGSPSLGTVGWKVPWPSGCVTLCTLVAANGNLFTQNAQIQLTVQQGSDVNTEWQGVELWFRGYSTNYNRAYPLSDALTLPNGTILGTWSTTIAQTLSSGSVACSSGNCGSTVSTSPSYTVTQYVMNTFTVPQTSSSYNVPYNQNTVAQYIQNGNPLSPDTQMYQETYFEVTLSNFGSYGYGCGLFGLQTCEGDPQITLNFETWLLTMGQYILTNPNTQSLSTTVYPTNSCTLCGLPNLGIGGDFLAIVIVVAIVLIAWQLVKKNPGVKLVTKS